MNFSKRSYQPILRYLYTEVKKLWGEISLHKHFKVAKGRFQRLIFQHYTIPTFYLSCSNFDELKIWLDLGLGLRFNFAY